MTILAVIVVGFAGFFIFSQNSSNKNSGGGGSNAQASSHIEGKGAKGVTLLEYGDYQCPVCQRYHATLEQVESANANDIFFQFRNLPLVSVHPNAFAAARAAEAAGLQNKYFDMHRMLYDDTNWQQWTTSQSPASLFEGYAKQLGLNIDQFKADYSSSKVNDTINADLAEFKKTGQEMATPSFFLDGQHIENSKLVDSTGAPSAEKFQQLIDAAVAKKASNQ